MQAKAPARKDAEKGNHSFIAGGNAGMQTGTALSMSECHFSEKKKSWVESVCHNTQI